MKIKSLASIALVSSVFCLPAMAETKEVGSGPNPFSDCGIGAALFDNDAGATISNIIWDIGTTAVTSATASPETCNKKETVAAVFILESYDNLVVEAAHGEGEHFSTLMNILDVNESDRDSVMLSVRSDMAAKISEASYTGSTQQERAEMYYDSVVNAVSNAA